MDNDKTNLGRKTGIPNAQTTGPTRRTTILLPADLRDWLDERSEAHKVSITAMAISLFRQYRQQIDGAIGAEGSSDD